MSYDRTLYEARLDIRYGQRFSELNERFYNHLDAIFGGVQLLMGSAAASALLGSNSGAVAWAGAVIATVAIVERVVVAGRKAEKFAQARALWGELDARSGSMSLDDVDCELRKLQSTLPTGVGLLEKPAHNANLMSHGHADLVLPLSRLERLVQMLA